MSYLLMEAGTEFYGVEQFAVLSPVEFKDERTYAERRREALVWKAAVRKGKWMFALKIFLGIALAIAGSAATLFVGVLLSRWLNIFSAFGLGYCGAMLILIGWLFIAASIESDPNHIRINRKRK